jgi:hypothetical protein
MLGVHTEGCPPKEDQNIHSMNNIMLSAPKFGTRRSSRAFDSAEIVTRADEANLSMG